MIIILSRLEIIKLNKYYISKVIQDEKGCYLLNFWDKSIF
jgi:hypothetical protein